MDWIARRKCLDPSTGFEILVPGRQDLLYGAVNPARGSADLLRPFAARLSFYPNVFPFQPQLPAGTSVKFG